jgi:hypothetical protein
MMRRAVRLLGALAITAASAWALVALAAPPGKVQHAAGPVPTDAQAQTAIVRYFQRRNTTLNMRKPFRVLSGPTLASGNTFAGELEQAWLMCIVVNAERVEPGPTDLEGASLYLRTSGGTVQVVATENWKDSSPKCN